MINLKDITQAVETILSANLSGYAIERNAERNVNPDVAARGSGWIGIYRAGLSYAPAGIGGQNWLANIKIKVEVQVASMKSGADAEDRLQDAELALLNVLKANKKLSGTVDQTTGWNVDYEYNNRDRIWFHAAVVTINAEVRTS